MIISQKCNCCAHEQVCGFKEEYIAACEAIKRASYTTGNLRHGVLFVKDSTVSVSISCPHIMPQKATRDGSAEMKKTAKWIYWPGWMSNHDKRIDDAECSECGYKHPTVKGSPNLLADKCPMCHRMMDKGGE